MAKKKNGKKRNGSRKPFMPYANALELAQYTYGYLSKSRRLASADYADGAFEELPGLILIDSLLHRFSPEPSEESAEYFMREIQENAVILLEAYKHITRQFQDDGEVEAELGAHLLQTNPALVVDELLKDDEFIEDYQFLTETQSIFSSELGEPRNMWSLHEASINRFTQQYVAGAEHKITSNASSGGRTKNSNAKTTPDKLLIKKCWEDWQDGTTSYKNQVKFIDAMSQKVKELKCNSTTIYGWIREWQDERNACP